jgi:hypothetical protein
MNRRFGANGEASSNTLVSTRTRVPLAGTMSNLRAIDGSIIARAESLATAWCTTPSAPTYLGEIQLILGDRVRPLAKRLPGDHSSVGARWRLERQ